MNAVTTQYPHRHPELVSGYRLLQPIQATEIATNHTLKQVQGDGEGSTLIHPFAPASPQTSVALPKKIYTPYDPTTGKVEMPETNAQENANAKLEWQTPTLENLGTGIGDVAGALDLGNDGTAEGIAGS